MVGSLFRKQKKYFWTRDKTFPLLSPSRDEHVQLVVAAFLPAPVHERVQRLGAGMQLIVVVLLAAAREERGDVLRLGERPLLSGLQNVGNVVVFENVAVVDERRRRSVLEEVVGVEVLGLFALGHGEHESGRPGHVLHPGCCSVILWASLTLHRRPEEA